MSWTAVSTNARMIWEPLEQVVFSPNRDPKEIKKLIENADELLHKHCKKHFPEKPDDFYKFIQKRQINIKVNPLTTLEVLSNGFFQKMAPQEPSKNHETIKEFIVKKCFNKTLKDTKTPDAQEALEEWYANLIELTVKPDVLDRVIERKKEKKRIESSVQKYFGPEKNKFDHRCLYEITKLFLDIKQISMQGPNGNQIFDLLSQSFKDIAKSKDPKKKTERYVDACERAQKKFESPFKRRIRLQAEESERMSDFFKGLASPSCRSHEETTDDENKTGTE